MLLTLKKNETNMNTISKRKCCDSDKTDDVVFVYPFNYNIDKENK